MLKALVIAVVAIALLTSPATAATKLTTAERGVIRAVNDTRRAHGVKALRVDWALTRAARLRSRQLLALGRLEHGDFASRLRALGELGVIGENLAWASGPYRRGAALVRAWLNSPPHRANLLRPGFQRIGLGVVQGTFAGYSDAVVVTAEFAG